MSFKKRHSQAFMLNLQKLLAARKTKHFLSLNEREDQALSIGGKLNPVQCLERWQIAVKIEIF